MKAKEDLVAIRIKVRLGHLHGQKRMVYPDLNNLPGNVRGDMDWSSFVDIFGTGLEYDKVCGYGKTDESNDDKMVQHVCTCVPSEFAAAAVAAFPTLIEEIEESDMEVFYDERAHKDTPDVEADNDTLQTIVHKKALGIALSDADNDAIDPAKKSKGLRPNPHATWARHKAERGLDDVKTFKAKQ